MNDANNSAIKSAINKLYGSNAGSSGIQLSKRWFDDSEPHLWQRDPGSNVAPQPPQRREYIANIVSEKFALNGSYAIYVFLGNFDANDPACWPTAPNLVGTHAVFAALPNDAEGNGLQAARAASGIQVTGTMPLTSTLLKKAQSGELGTMRPQDVEDYMAKNLHWRVRMVSPDLQVSST
jgi:tyrosinase